MSPNDSKYQEDTGRTTLSGNGATSANPLSDREMEVSRLLVTGATNSEIARELVISPHTVKVHLRNVFEKLQVSSRTEASMVLLQRGWLTVPGIEVAESGPPGNEQHEEVTSPDTNAVSLLPEPEPIDDLAQEPLPWQRVYLFAITAVCLGALLLPGLLSRPKSAFSLLSDAAQTAVGRPALEMLPRWELHTPLASPRSRMGAALDGDLVYVVGGEGEDGQVVGDVLAYDLRSNQWSQLAALPQPLANVAVEIVNGNLFVAGGSGPVDVDYTELPVSDELLVYQEATGSWSAAGSLPTALAGAALVAHDDALYLLGGWDGEQMRDEVWRLPLPDPFVLEDMPAWELVSRLQVAMAFFGATVVDDNIYVIGGYDGQRELADAAALQVPDMTWTKLPALSTPRSGLSTVYDGLAVVALGGGWTRTVDTHERYDPLTNQWSNFPSPIQGEWRHFVAAQKDGSIYLIGGWSGDYLDLQMEYQSTFRALLPVISND